MRRFTSVVEMLRDRFAASQRTRRAAIASAETMERRTLLSAVAMPLDAYLFDEGSGTTVIDTGAPGGNNGVLMGASPPTFVAGPSNSSRDFALKFTGDGQYNRPLAANPNGIVQLTSNLDTILGGTASLAAWVKTTQVGSAPPSQSFDDPAISGSEQFGAADDIRWGFLDSSGRIGIGPGDGPSALSSAPVNDGQWHLVVLTRDAGTGQLQVYVDGFLENQANGDVGIKHCPFSVIGANTNYDQAELNVTGYNFFNGQIDDVRIYNTVLSQTQVDSLLPQTDHAPTPPTNLAGAASGAAITLHWTDNADNELGFIVLRADSANGPFAEIGTAPPLAGTGATGTFIDTGPNKQIGRAYFYEVEAFNGFMGLTTSAPAGPTAIPFGAAGAGVEAHYFAQGYWSGSPKIDTLVSSVDFNWPGTPDPSIQKFSNAAIFTGKVKAPTSGLYTFVSNTGDDGFLWVNGVLASQDYGGHGEENAPHLFPIALSGGQSYDLVLMQSQGTGASPGAHLEWVTPSAAGQAPTVVPTDDLFSTMDQPLSPGGLSVSGAPTANRVVLSYAPGGSADDPANNAVVFYLLQRRTSASGAAPPGPWVTISRSDPGVTTVEDAAPLAGTSCDYRVVAWNFDTPPNLDANASPVVTVTVPTQAQAQIPGAEGHYYNADVASHDLNQDPRNFALADLQPAEFQAVSGPVNFNYNDSPDPSRTADPVSRLTGPDFIHREEFATVWTGKIVTDQAGVYTFISNTDDDGYFYVNDVLVSADPGQHGVQDASAARAGDTVKPLTLAAHTAYDFVFIQQQIASLSGVHIEWIEPGHTAPALIPAMTSASGGLEQIADLPHHETVDAAGAVTDVPTESAAGNLAVVQYAPGGATLAWADQSTSELWFEVQRSGDGGTSWTTIGKTGFDSGSFTDAAVNSRASTTVFLYRLRGVNFDGSGPWSNVARTDNVMMPTPGLVGQACAVGMAHLIITGQSVNSGGIEIQQSLDGATWMDAAGSPAAADAVSFDVSNLDPTRTYLFRARNLPGSLAPNASPYSNVVAVSAAGPQPIDDSAGFVSSSGLQLNGSANVTSPTAAAPSALQLTPNALSQDGTAFTVGVQAVSGFDTTFDFAFLGFGGNAQSDGFTFIIQNSPAGPAAFDPNAGGGGLGYGADSPSGPRGIPDSVAVKFDLYNNQGEGFNSTGLFIDGDSPTVPTGANPVEATVDLTPSAVNLHALGNTFEAHLFYDGTTLHETVTDLTIGSVFSHDYAIDIPKVVGGPCAWVGFTGGTGIGSTEQDILAWTFTGGTRGPAPEIINGTPGNDAITLKQDADHRHIDWTLNASTQGKVLIANPAGLVINGNGGTDTIALDSGNGNPLPNLLSLNGTFVINGLTSLSFGQTVDVARSTVRISYTGSSPLALIQGALRSGYDGGRWDGPGIRSSVAAVNPGSAVADVDDGSAIALSYRPIGDADGSGSVDFADLVRLARNFGRQIADWSQGDFNYDGQVNFDDLLLLARHYRQSALSAVDAVHGRVLSRPLVRRGRT